MIHSIHQHIIPIRLQISTTKKQLDYIKEKTSDFGFVLLLALGAVVDSHVELRCANMEIKGHEELLMEVMILRKS
jgi:hypothetical protein